MKSKELFLLEREYLFNYGEDYSVLYKEDFSGAGQASVIEITNDEGELDNNPIIMLEIMNKIQDQNN